MLAAFLLGRKMAERLKPAHDRFLLVYRVGWSMVASFGFGMNQSRIRTSERINLLQLRNVMDVIQLVTTPCTVEVD